MNREMKKVMREARLQKLRETKEKKRRGGKSTENIDVIVEGEVSQRGIDFRAGGEVFQL
jgi:hypothetical protein